LTGNQTKAGILTFSSSPIAPTPTAGDNSTKVATTAFCASQDLGVGQTWQNVTASRTAGATYTNTTGKPIFVAYNNIKVGSNGVKITVNGLPLYSTVYNSISANHDGNVITFIVPNNSTYRADATEGTLEFLWYELR
jgi:hypothetical protein